ncbi:peptidase [Caulobacter sp. CCUG 60055]|nr:PepSY-associated TM helix domain-containing protein [Caulobacter sp. CCUG 60055]MCI3181639.1 peptidase [Caulobacter sp. CCUG 60055]
MSRHPGRPIWPKVRPGFVKEALAGHSALGLFAGAMIYLVCLSGTVAVFVADLRAWEAPQAPRIETVGAAAIDRAVARATADDAVSAVYVMLPRMVAGRMTVAAYGGKAEATQWVGPGGASFGELKTPWTDFVDGLHMYLTLPRTIGMIAVGLVGVMLLTLLISGVLAHPRAFRDAFTLRLGGSKRIQEADLHNRLSIWGLPFHLTVTLTGTFFGLANLLALALATAAYDGDVAKVYAPLEGPAARAAASPPPPMGPIFAQLGVVDPARQVNYVGIEQPGKAGQRIAVELAAPDRLPRGDRWFFDGAGKLIGRDGGATGSVGAQTYAAVATLHFGSFGGWPVRLVYGVLGLALTAIAAGGLSIWFARRRDAGRPAPRLESAWLGWVWGVPAAMTVSALATGAAAPTLVFWPLAILLAAGAAVLGRPKAAARSGRFALGVSLMALSVAYASRHPGPAQTVSAGAVQALCLLLGLGLVAGVMRGLRGRWIGG